MITYCNKMVAYCHSAVSLISNRVDMFCVLHICSLQVAIKEMEAAAIAWVCGLFGTPFFCVKAVTDIVDGGRPSHEEFMVGAVMSKFSDFYCF